uniref:NADH dehydrogenase subunit 2 n=1 Tax=Liorhyssus hyalinus TaxID=883173 RepID=UPI001FA7E0A7
MKLNSTKLLFLMMMIISTMITLSAENWMGMWMGLEINLMSFIPFISKMKSKNVSQAMMIYFLTQSIGSILLLFSIILSNMMFISPMMIKEISIMLVLTSMLIKLGSAPFHFWLPEMMSNMNWMECSLLLTWQKIAPLSIINNLMFNNWLVYLCAVLSAFMGAVGGLNQTSLRKIMAYSSINHLGWMLMFMSMNSSWYKYLLIYSIMVILACKFFSLKNIFFINQMSFSSNSLLEKYIFVILLMSLGGLPPFLGFLPKWMVIQSMINSNLNIIIILMMLFSLITLFYYLRLVTPLILSYSSMMKWNYFKSNNIMFLYLIFSINISLPMFSVLSFF